MSKALFFFAGTVFWAGCQGTPPRHQTAAPATSTAPATQSAVVPPATAPATESAAELPGTFYTLPNGAAVESVDGLFLAELVENGKVVGVFLANGPVVVNDNGTLRVDIGGLHIGGMKINRNLTLYHLSAGGAKIDGGTLPEIEGDVVAGYKAALTKNPKLTLAEYLRGTALKDAAAKLTGLDL